MTSDLRPPLTLLLHDDWELFGDGSGDMTSHLFDPAKRNLDLCDTFGAKYTFFAECAQQWAMLESPHSVHRRDAAEWERILVDAVQRGHDVQLHLHPQWLDARFRNNAWELDYSKWALSALPPAQIRSIIKRGVQYLEDLLRPHNPQYATVAFRAGGWMIQPSEYIISALRTNGIVADVTVMPGKVLQSASLGGIDFRNTPSRHQPWYCSAIDVCQAGTADQGVLCIPTYARPQQRRQRIHDLIRFPGWGPYQVRKRLRVRSTYRPVYSRSHSPDQLRTISTPLREIDFGSTYYRIIDQEIRHVQSLYREAADCPCPVMILLTHSKTFYSHTNFSRLLALQHKRGGIKYSTTQHVVQTWTQAEEVRANSKGVPS